MVGTFLQRPVKDQCGIVGDVCSLDCCGSSPTGICLDTQWPDKVYPLYGIPCSQPPAVPKEAQIRAEIDSQRPVQYYLDYGGGIAHTGLIVGYDPAGTFEVNDPKRGQGVWSYYDIKTGFDQSATWTKTYLFK